MYVDRDAWPPPRPWQPPPRRKPRDRRGSAAVWIIVVVLLASFLGPIGGATIIDAFVALARH